MRWPTVVPTPPFCLHPTRKPPIPAHCRIRHGCEWAPARPWRPPSISTDSLSSVLYACILLRPLPHSPALPIPPGDAWNADLLCIMRHNVQPGYTVRASRRGRRQGRGGGTPTPTPAPRPPPTPTLPPTGHPAMDRPSRRRCPVDVISTRHVTGRMAITPPRGRSRGRDRGAGGRFRCTSPGPNF